MTDRHQHVGFGGMTGATGDLTPDNVDQAFVPGERREIEALEHHASATQTQAMQAPTQADVIGDPSFESERVATNMAERDGNSESERGLNQNDPAYRMKFRPLSPLEVASAARGRSAYIGGDQLSDHEERF